MPKYESRKPTDFIFGTCKSPGKQIEFIKIRTNVGLAHASVKGKNYGKKRMENPKTYDKQLQKLSQIYVVDLFGSDGSWIFGKYSESLSP